MRLLLKTTSAAAWGHSSVSPSSRNAVAFGIGVTLGYIASLGMTEARLFARDGHGNSEEKISSSARVYSLQRAPGTLLPAGALLRPQELSQRAVELVETEGLLQHGHPARSRVMTGLGDFEPAGIQEDGQVRPEVLARPY
jgi:hypothetical protein